MKEYLIATILVCVGHLSFAQCANEDFESGNTNGWSGFTGKITYTGNVDVNAAGMVSGRHTIMSGLQMDEISTQCGVPLPRVAPGGLYSLRLGNGNVGAEAERITKTFVVEPGKEFFLYKYAVVLEDPQHQSHEQPRFEVRVFDKNGKLAPCGVFRVRAGPNAAKTISRVDENPGTKNPDDCKLIGIFIYPVCAPSMSAGMERYLLFERVKISYWRVGEAS